MRREPLAQAQEITIKIQGRKYMQTVWASNKIKCGDEKDHRFHHWTCTLITEPPSSWAQSCCLHLQRWGFTPSWFLWSGGAAVAVVDKNWNSVQVSDKGRFSRNEYSRQQCLRGIKKGEEINRESVVTAAASVSRGAHWPSFIFTREDLWLLDSARLLQVLFIYWWFIGKKEVCFLCV